MHIWNSDLTLDSDNLLNDLSNAILLRSDLHTAFNDRKFVLFPKGDNGFVVHMLEPAPDLAQLYHNVQIEALGQYNAQFLYTRFAWAIFPSLSSFLSKPNAPRAVLIAKRDGTSNKWVAEDFVSSEKLQAKASASCSQSPKKRQRAVDDAGDREEYLITPKRLKIIDNRPLAFISDNKLPLVGEAKNNTDMSKDGGPAPNETLSELEMQEDLQIQASYLPDRERVKSHQLPKD